MKWKCSECGRIFEGQPINHLKPEYADDPKYKDSYPAKDPQAFCKGELYYAGDSVEVLEYLALLRNKSSTEDLVEEVVRVHPQYYPSCLREFRRGSRRIRDVTEKHCDIEHIYLGTDQITVIITAPGHEGEERLHFDPEDILIEEKRKNLMHHHRNKLKMLFQQRLSNDRRRISAAQTKEMEEKKELRRLMKKYPEEAKKNV